MTLFFYFARRFLAAFTKVLLILLLLVLVVDTLEQIRSLSDKGVSVSFALQLALVRTPGFLSEVMPVIVMISSLTFCLGLARSNEFVVSRAAGVSALRAIRMPVACAFSIGLASILFLNPLVASLSAQEEAMRSSLGKPNLQQLSINAEGFWLRQKNPEGHTVIHGKTANGKGSLLRTVMAVEFDENGDASKRIESRTAILNKGAWVFARGKEWTISKDTNNPEQIAEEFQVKRVPTTITPTQLLDGYPAPETLSIWELPAFIKTIDRAGFSSIRHRVHYNLELARPFLFAAMVIIGAAFTLKNARLGNLGLSTLTALICGFALHFLQNLARTFGEAGEIPVIVAAWVPPIAAIFLAVGLFLHLEDG